jgi:hypothetical protein
LIIIWGIAFEGNPFQVASAIHGERGLKPHGIFGITSKFKRIGRSTWMFWLNLFFGLLLLFEYYLD